MMKDKVFITSKPLQILVAASIIKQLKIENCSHLVIVDSFHDAKRTYERMKSANWSLRDIGVDFKPRMKEAYRLAKDNKFADVFIDADVGFRKYLTLASLKRAKREVGIHVYEEGLGTYRTDLYAGIKKAIFDALGIGTNFGGCSLTDSIYIFDDDRYREIFPDARVKAIKISRSIVDLIAEDFQWWAHVMNYEEIKPTNARLCNLYLSSWAADTDFIEKFRKMDGDKFVKPHPHIRENIEFPFLRTVNNTAPAELVLLDMAEKYDEVNVFHHGTSVANYVKKQNVSFSLCASRRKST